MALLKLNEDEIAGGLEDAPGWAREGEALVRQYQFQDFVQALRFVIRLGEAAEAAQHHPDIDIRYNKVRLLLTTHDSGGITRNDLDLAAAADGLADAVRQ